MISKKQLLMAEFFSDCKDLVENDKYYFLSLLENTINLNKFIAISFSNNFYSSTGRPRKYSLQSMLWL